jgi:hypothetical protein
MRFLRYEMNKIRSHLYMLKNKLLIIALNIYCLFVAVESTACIFIRFALAQLSSSTPYSLPGAASPLTDVATPLRCVTLLSYRAKTSSLSPLHLSTMLHPIASPLEPKPKY